MSFPRYAEYKDSGVEWVGQVPEHWVTCSLGCRLAQQPCYGVLVPDFDIDGVPMLRILDIDNGVVNRGALTTISAALSAQYSRTIVKVSDVVLSVVGTIGECLIVDEGLTGVNLSRALARIIPGRGLTGQWLKWIFTSPLFGRYVDLVCVGSAQRVLNMDDLRAFRIPCPNVSEQSAISTFLNRETGKIDALVAEQENLIALLKEKRQAVISHAVTKGLNPDAPMKPSGIEWLGDVPAHWEGIRLAELFREVSDAGSDALPILSVSIHRGVSDSELDADEMERKVTRSDDRSKYKAVRRGDLAYNMMRAWQGGFGAVMVNGQVSPAYVVARPRRELRTDFIEQLLRTPNAVELMRQLSRGITDFRLRLYWEEFRSIKIALPPTDEQIAILKAVEIQTSQFDALTAEAAQTITLLKERRSALISAAVTGQIDVGGLASLPAEAA